MDAACKQDSQRDETLKYSTGYCPPEFAQYLFNNNNNNNSTRHIEKIKVHLIFGH